MTENINANDKYITKLLEIYASFQQTKIQDLPTRQNNLLNIIVTTDHAHLKYNHQKMYLAYQTKKMKITNGTLHQAMLPTQQAKKMLHVFKSNLEKLYKEISKLSIKIKLMYEGGTHVQEMSGTYKNKHFKIMNNYIPSKKNRFQKSIFPGEHTNSYLEKKEYTAMPKKAKHTNI